MAFLALTLVAFGLIVSAAMPGHWHRLIALWAVPLNLGFVALVSVFVFGADTYTNDGRSRWATRGGTDHILYIATVAAAVVASGLFAVIAARKSSGWVVRPSLLLSGAGDFILGLLVGLAFGAN